MKIVFMGTPSYATTILKSLLNDSRFEVLSLITQPDKPVGRKQILTPSDTKKYCIDHDINIDIFQPKTLKSKESVEYIKSKKPDFIVVAAYGQILPKDVLDIAVCINLHASILPKYRGASPIQSAILDMQRYSGVTAMKMDEGLDTGDMLSFSILDIEDYNAVELFEKLALLGAELCVKTLLMYDEISALKQRDFESSYAKKITKADGEICFDNAQKIFARYKAFIYWPGIYLKSGLKLKEILLSSINGTHKSGEILQIKDQSIIVGCKKGTIEIFKVQPPSKKEMIVLDYIRGKRLKVGDTLS